VLDITDAIRGKRVKMQYFSAVFTTLHGADRRTATLFCYFIETGRKMRVEEYFFDR